jgi:membrane protease YdiL (CAAX protease family)
MFLFAQQDAVHFSPWFLSILAVVFMAFFYVWLILAGRISKGRSILPAYQPRRPVSWTGLDLLVIFFFYLTISSLAGIGRPVSQRYFLELTGANAILKPNESQPAVERKADEEKTAAHPLAQLLKNKDMKVLALCAIVGAGIVPIAEETLFRLLLQGWLESAERGWRRRWRGAIRKLPRGILPILAVSLFFASLHFRKAKTESEPSNLFFDMFLLGVIHLLVIGFAWLWVRRRAGATAQDLGWDASKFGGDVLAGIAAFFAVVVPIFAIQIVFGAYLLPIEYAPDPISIFFFAVVLGTLYFRTHRLVPSIVMHAMLNGFSLAMAWSMMK